MADGKPGVDYSRKEDFCWISMIRLPEFATEEVLEWAKKEAVEKKKLDTSCARFLTLDEGRARNGIAGAKKENLSIAQ